MRALILAEGQKIGTHSKKPRVSQMIMGKPMMQYPIEACINAGIEDITVVVNHDDASIRAVIPYNVNYKVREEPPDIWNALASVSNEFKTGDGVLILRGDMPLIDAAFIGGFAKFCSDANAEAVAVSAPGTHGFGALYVRGETIIKSALLTERLPDESPFDYFKRSGCDVRSYIADTPAVTFAGVDNYLQLAEVSALMKARINARHMANGAQMLDPNTTYIDDTVEIAEDVILYPSVILEGNCKLEMGVVIGANSRLVNTIVGNGTHIQYSVLNDAVIGRNTEVGPFAYLRPGVVIGDNCRVGDFVEVKNANIGNRTKIAHLGYVGDSDIGENVNWGCGAITANYDGKNKRRTMVMDNVFIGCNTNLIAPVTIGSGAFIAAGSTITEEVPPASLAIARQRQVVKKDWKNNNYTQNISEN